MTWYRCFIEGVDFPGQLIGKSDPVGFYTTRWVEASSPEEAEFAALETLRNEPKFQPPPGGDTSSARVFITEIMEVEGPGGPNVGATWYPMKDADDSTGIELL